MSLSFIPKTIVAVGLMVCVTSGTASAVDARNFQPGRIIDDQVFTDSSSMTVDQIQSFLNSKVSCDTWGVKRSELGGGTRAQWMAARGYSPPFRCVTDYIENPSTGANNYGTNSTPNGGLSAAQLIYNYSKQFTINPQVLLVTLQKENGLITDEWPTLKQYREAMGFGCPDNVAPGAPACDPTYGSFSAQLYQAARHFRGYIDRPAGWWIPFNTGWNNIMWSPNQPVCGSSQVYIQNRATAALYSYTPYQPNAAALAAQYGLGDNCSAYGNRNFYMYFTDWFGSTTLDGYRWQPVSQEYFTDSTKSIRAGADIPPGGKLHLVLKVRNTGSITWSNKDGEFPVNLATLPADNSSAFCSPGWLSCNRPARLMESSVATGEIGTFEFEVSNNTNLSGNHRLYVSLVAEGKAWFNNPAVNFYLTPQTAKYTWSIQSQQAYTDSSMTTHKNMWYTRPGETAYLVIKALNTGNVTWKKDSLNPIHLAVVNDKKSSLCNSGWLSCNRPAKLTEDEIAPGQVGTFAFPVTIPNSPGDYIEYYGLVSEGRAWFDSTGINYWVKIVR